MKSDEAKRKKLYVERDISWMYFNQRDGLKLPARKFRYWNNLPFWAFTLTI